VSGLALVALPLAPLPQPVGSPATSPAFLSPTGVELTFIVVGVVALASAVLVVTTRQMVHAALWLVVTLGSLAACYLLLTAEFVAWVQVLIYVGAVVVLLLFGLMLTRAPIGPSEGLDSENRIAAVVVGAASAIALVIVVVDAFKQAYIDFSSLKPSGTARVTGSTIFRSWVLPFEVLSVLLLAALVAAIVISRGPLTRNGEG
jgi:NADH-quinone oxidoreductase subunit J